jgi:LPS sulfotransferase NodH
MGLRETLFSTEMDLPCRDPSQFYVIATHQRTKSSLLCKWLWDTGDFGAPWEYHLFPPKRFGQYTHPHNPDHLDLNLDAIYPNRTTPNGVFGIKVMPEPSRPNILPPTDKFIYLNRRDKIAKAISGIISGLTNQFWSVDTPIGNVPEYNGELIEAFVLEHVKEEQFWEDHFTQNNITPLRLWAEELEYDTSLAQISQYLNVPITRLFSPPPFPDIQEQGRSAIISEYKERFLRENPSFSSFE